MFSTDGIDLSLVDEFDKIEDIRSYLISKYGLEFCNRIMELVPTYLPDDYEDTNSLRRVTSNM